MYQPLGIELRPLLTAAEEFVDGVSHLVPPGRGLGAVYINAGQGRTCTATAWGPRSPASESKETRLFSSSVRKPPLLTIPEKWTKRSLLPESGVMNPKPFSALNGTAAPIETSDLACPRGWAWKDDHRAQALSERVP